MYGQGCVRLWEVLSRRGEDEGGREMNLWKENQACCNHRICEWQIRFCYLLKDY